MTKNPFKYHMNLLAQFRIPTTRRKGLWAYSTQMIGKIGHHYPIKRNAIGKYNKVMCDD